MYDDYWHLSTALSTPDRQLEAMQLFVHVLPETQLSELKYLCAFLHEVSKQKHIRLVHKVCDVRSYNMSLLYNLVLVQEKFLDIALVRYVRN